MLNAEFKMVLFLANVNSITHVHVRYMSSPVRLSVVCRLPVCLCNVRDVPY